MAKKHDKYLICGDVYRRDEIDATHFPVFHQIDCFAKSDNPGKDLRDNLTNLIRKLFGNINFKFLEDYENPDVHFPFTINSLEVEIEFNGKKMEILGGGTVHPEILESLKIKSNAFAFGLGLERLAMAMFEVPDIRYFWSEDERFTSQFKSGQITKFKSYSKYESCYKDISMFIDERFNFNDLNEIVRKHDSDNIVESVKLIDKFTNKSGKTSHCYRIQYRSMDRTLTNQEIDSIQFKIRDDAKLIAELR